MEGVILGIVGVVLSLVFSYVPKAHEWLSGFEQKGLVMLGLVVVVGAGYFALGCSPFGADFGVTVACTRAGLFDLLKAIFVIASGNQLTFLLTRKTERLG